MSVFDRALRNSIDTDLGRCLRLEVTDDQVFANTFGHSRIAWLCCYLIRLSVMVQVRLLRVRRPPELTSETCEFKGGTRAS